MSSDSSEEVNEPVLKKVKFNTEALSQITSSFFKPPKGDILLRTSAQGLGSKKEETSQEKKEQGQFIAPGLKKS